MNIKTQFYTIGAGLEPYVIAEIGLNHNGILELAKQMAQSAASCGAHAVKFQLYDSDFFLQSAARLGDGKPGSLPEFFRSFELKKKEWIELAAFVRKCGVDFICSVFDSPSLDFYMTLNPSLIKISSCDIDNRILLEEAAAKQLPILLSTGTATEEEIKNALEWIRPGGAPVVLMQCVSSYPADPADYNLNVLARWREVFQLPAGISDHCEENFISAAATALGACVIERHFTLDRNLPGPDQKISLDPARLSEMTRAVKAVYAGLGNGKKVSCLSEEAPRKYGRRALYAARDIPAGSAVGSGDFIAKRPGGGISPSRIGDLAGKKTAVKIKKDEMFTGEQFL